MNNWLDKGKLLLEALLELAKIINAAVVPFVVIAKQITAACMKIKQIFTGRE